MSEELKSAWKKTGVTLGHAFRDLGKTLLKTGSEVMKNVEEWADEQEEKKAEGEEPIEAEFEEVVEASAQPSEEE